jgi:hypothetical protein
MTLGIAIPCYSPHVGFLPYLLEKLNGSTVVPSQVSISISSFDGNLELPNYDFEVTIVKTSEFGNPCYNRNVAANNLTTDIISFIDADDLPNLKRNEFILKCFELGAEIVVHDYHQESNRGSHFYNSDPGQLNFNKDYIDTINDVNTFPFNKNIHLAYACGHPSLTKNIFNKIKYDESIGNQPGEDGKFLKSLVINGYKISHINNKLSQYII